MLLVLILHTGRILGLIFRWEPEGIGTRVHHVNCSYISELHVGFWITQIGPLQLKLCSISRNFHSWAVYLFCPDFFTDFGTNFWD